MRIGGIGELGTMKKTPLFVDVVCYLFLFLFLYTAYDKFANMEKFVKTLSRSQMIGEQFAPLLARAIPTAEALICVFLITPGTYRRALWASVILMGIFTAYLAIMLATGLPLTCNCGGVISSFSWPQHIAFNCFFIVIGLAALFYEKLKTAYHNKFNSFQNNGRDGNINQSIFNH